MSRFFGEFAATRFSNDDIRKRHRNSSLRWRSSRSRLRNMTIFPKEIVPKPRSDGCAPSAQTCRNHTGRVPCEVGHLTCRQSSLRLSLSISPGFPETDSTASRIWSRASFDSTSQQVSHPQAEASTAGSMYTSPSSFSGFKRNENGPPPHFLLQRILVAVHCNPVHPSANFGLGWTV